MGIKLLKRFSNSESGASMVEYGVALLVVTAIGITLVTNLGEEVETKVQGACTGLKGSACTT